MDRITLRIPNAQLEAVEAMVEDGEFPNRSEAVRQAIRELVDDRTADTARGGDRTWPNP